MAPLANIALLVLFAIVIFAIIGLEVYNGQQFHHACRYIGTDGEKNNNFHTVHLFYYCIMHIAHCILHIAYMYLRSIEHELTNVAQVSLEGTRYDGPQSTSSIRGDHMLGSQIELSVASRGTYLMSVWPCFVMFESPCYLL